jgi:hypothetical protein
MYSHDSNPLTNAAEELRTSRIISYAEQDILFKEALTEYLDELKAKGEKSETAKYIGNIYLKMLEKITPDYDQEHIRSIVEFLYSAGSTDSADRIFNIYASRGHEFLRDVHDKHNKKPYKKP